MMNRDAQLKLRLSEAMRRDIERAAKKNGRSMNSEICDRIEASFHASNIQDIVRKAVSDEFAKRQVQPTVIENWAPGHLARLSTKGYHC